MEKPEGSKEDQKGQGTAFFGCFHGNPRSFYQVDPIVAYRFLGSLFVKFKISLFLL